MFHDGPNLFRHADVRGHDWGRDVVLRPARPHDLQAKPALRTAPPPVRSAIPLARQRYWRVTGSAVSSTARLPNADRASAEMVGEISKTLIRTAWRAGSIPQPRRLLPTSVRHGWTTCSRFRTPSSAARLGPATTNPRRHGFGY